MNRGFRLVEWHIPGRRIRFERSSAFLLLSLGQSQFQNVTTAVNVANATATVNIPAKSTLAERFRAERWPRTERAREGRVRASRRQGPWRRRATLRAPSRRRTRERKDGARETGELSPAHPQRPDAFTQVAQEALRSPQIPNDHFWVRLSGHSPKLDANRSSMARRAEEITEACAIRR